MRMAETRSPSFILSIAVVLGSGVVEANDWPQWLGPKRDAVWRETGLLERFPADGPKFLWKTPLGTGYSGPAVADGFVYVMDRQRPVDADGNTGDWQP